VDYLFITIDHLENRTRLLNHIHTAQAMGHRVTVVASGGYKQSDYDFNLVGIRVAFKRGPLKFLVFNLKLAFFLFFRKFDCLYLRGVWVTPGVMLATFFKKQTYIYDAHEYFAGLTLVQNRMLRRLTWLPFEKWIVNKSTGVLTVSEPIVEQYLKRYPKLKKITVIRNLPCLQSVQTHLPETQQIHYQQRVICFFGYFMEGRGLVNLLHAIKEIPGVLLLLAGEGEIKQTLVALAETLKIDHRVHFRPFIPNKDLISFISQAYIGVSLLEPISDNHRYALPNKLFECMMAGLPILASDIETHRYYIETYDVGMVVDATSPSSIRDGIMHMLQDQKQWEKWHKNCFTASGKLNWQLEAEKLKAEFRLMDQEVARYVG
jgi:glycosyltransferase involved in cell wall biosynthesis